MLPVYSIWVFETISRPVVLNSGCTLESPRELFKNTKPRPHPKPIKSDTLGVRSRLRCLLKSPPIILMFIQAWEPLISAFRSINLLLDGCLTSLILFAKIPFSLNKLFLFPYFTIVPPLLSIAKDFYNRKRLIWINVELKRNAVF